MLKETFRLNKFISESGYCSRREADRHIENGNVFINGKRAGIGDQVKSGDIVKVNGYELEPRDSQGLIFIALNKPVGVTSTTEKGVPNNIVSFVNHSSRIFPIGRLDKDSQGLIFLTNDGDVVNKILRAGNKHEKEYVVTVNKPLTPEMIESMASGVPILGVNTKKCKVSQEAPNVFRIVLVQGLNRQIRRMCEHFGYDVVKLERVRIMNIGLKGLPLGEWRELTPTELKIVYSMIEDSDNDVVVKPKPIAKKKEGNKPKEHKGNNASFKPKSGKPHHAHGRSGDKNRPSKGRKSNNHKRGR